MKLRNHPIVSKRQTLLFLVDFFIVAWFVAVHPLREIPGKVFLYSIVFFLPYFFMYYIFDLYNLNRNYRKNKEILRVASVVVIGFIFSSFVFSFIDVLYRMFHFLLFLNILLAMPAWRYLFNYICAAKPVIKKCLIIGAGEQGLDTFHLIHNNPFSGLRVVGFADDSIEKQRSAEGKNINVLGAYSEIREIVKKYGINIVIVALPENGFKELLTPLIEISETGAEVTTSTDVFSQLANRIPLSHINTRWIYLMSINKSSYYRLPLKRALDVSGAIAGILLSIPFYIIVPPIVKLTSRGPVFYKQERLGIHKSVFRILKFRTMVYAPHKNNHSSTLDNDSRITRIGKFLRRTKIDELPQFINVLKGEMSLVGPRPVSKEEEEEKLYEKNVPFWNLRFYLKPGISGWAQVNYPYGASVEEAATRMEYEIFYIKNNSFLLDLLVISKTIKTVFYMRGR